MSFDYQAFLAREGSPPHLQEGHPIGHWDALRMGSVTFPGTGQFMTWETYCLRLRELVDYPPYVETDRPSSWIWRCVRSARASPGKS